MRFVINTSNFSALELTIVEEQTEIHWERIMIKLALAIMALFLCVTPITGCSSGSSSTVTTTEVRRAPDSNYYSANNYDDSAVEVTKTETVTEEDDKGHGVFGIIGDVIALPFRALGAIF